MVSRARLLTTKEIIQPDLLCFSLVARFFCVDVRVQCAGFFIGSGFLALQLFLFLLFLGQVSLTFGEGVIGFGHGRSSRVEGEGGGARLPWVAMVAA